MQFDIWTQSLLTAMNTLWGKLAGFIPNLLGALVVVLLGFVIAKLLDALLSKLDVYKRQSPPCSTTAPSPTACTRASITSWSPCPPACSAWSARKPAPPG